MSSNLRESGRDLEIQTSYIIEEKRPISSDTSSRFRKNSALPSPETPENPAVVAEPKPPVRKYSKVWWESYWNNAIKVGQVPRIVYGGVGLVIVAAWILFTVLTAKDEVSWNKNQLIASQEYLQSSTASSATGGGLALEGSLKNFDPISRTLTVEWSGLKVDPDNPEADAVPFVNTTGLSNAFPIEIYRETATTIWIPDPPYNPEDPTSLLYYRIANLSTPAIAVIGWTEDDSFDTEISFKQAQDTSVITRLPLFAYPFDEWKGSISFTFNAIWAGKGTNQTKHYVGAPLGARLTDHALNWRFTLGQELNCLDPVKYIPEILQYFSLSDARNITETNLGWIKTPCYLKLDLIATRPPIVKFAAILSVIVNWTSTLFIFILTCEVLIMRRGFMMSGTDLLGVAFTSLFALPSIRLLLPGAPDFGALIDLIGIIPNVIIISACVCAIAVGKLNRRKRDKGEDSE